MKTQHLPASLAASVMVAALTCSVSTAGETPAASAPEPPSTADWCDWLQNKPGTLYKNKDNPWLQSFQLGGRLHYQAAYLEGDDVNGLDFDDTYDEFRRARIESKTEFLRYFTAIVGVNMVADGRRNGHDLDWGYQDFDEAYVTFDIGKAFDIEGLDTLKASYGRLKFKLSEEVHVSSKEILTIERSAIANKIYNGGRPTGFLLAGTKGPWGLTGAIMSTEEDSEFIGGWNDGIAWNLDATYKANDELRFRAGFVYNDSDKGEDDFLGYEWATAFDAIYEKDRFGMLAGLILGNNNDTTPDRGGSFHGFVAMPWYWIVDEKLQAVAEYSYAGASEASGVRIYSRYGTSQHSPGVDLNGGRGDSLHEIFLGLNYYLCGHNAKIMGGVHYQTMDTPSGDFDTLTYLIGFRTFF